MCLASDAHANQEGTANLGPSHGCQGGYSSSCPHPGCNQTARSDSLAKVVAKVDPADGDALAKFLNEPNVFFNTSSALSV